LPRDLIDLLKIRNYQARLLEQPQTPTRAEQAMLVQSDPTFNVPRSHRRCIGRRDNKWRCETCRRRRPSADREENGNARDRRKIAESIPTRRKYPSILANPISNVMEHGGHPQKLLKVISRALLVARRRLLLCAFHQGKLRGRHSPHALTNSRWPSASLRTIGATKSGNTLSTG
jgi:hypothetical protein